MCLNTYADNWEEVESSTALYSRHGASIKMDLVRFFLMTLIKPRTDNEWTEKTADWTTFPPRPGRLAWLQR